MDLEWNIFYMQLNVSLQLYIVLHICINCRYYSSLLRRICFLIASSLHSSSGFPEVFKGTILPVLLIFQQTMTSFTCFYTLLFQLFSTLYTPSFFPRCLEGPFHQLEILLVLNIQMELGERNPKKPLELIVCSTWKELKK